MAGPNVELLPPGRLPSGGRILPLVGFNGSAHEAARLLRQDIGPICQLLESDSRLAQQCHAASLGDGHRERDRFVRYAATKLMLGDWFLAVDDPNYKAIHESGVAAAVRFIDPTGLFDAHYSLRMEQASGVVVVGTLIADRFGGKFIPDAIKQPIGRWISSGVQNVTDFVRRLRGKKTVIVRAPLPYKYKVPPPHRVGAIFEVDLSDLRSRQGWVDEYGRYVPEEGVIPLVYWVDWVDDVKSGQRGFWAIFDGNKRAADAYRRGIRNVRVEVVDFVPPAVQNPGGGGPSIWGENIYKPFLEQTQVWERGNYVGDLKDLYNKPAIR